ncbi:MAG: hypothetical protein ACD_75C01862G0004 [uncultured bacterium]|nr:MAG: hypothetical protein ACD_75C01862G0004 [uncultured bacterium]
MRKKFVGWLVFPLLAFFFAGLRTELNAADSPPAGQWKILHVMSYHLPWEWTETQFNGFKEALHDLKVEYRVFQMNTKKNSSEQGKEKMGKEARDLIDSWQPDLVYANDDDAQQYVARHYVNRKLPFVFSGVNGAPEKYGFVGSSNITGVLEQEHFVESVLLLREIVPSVKKIAVIVDRDVMWQPVVARMKAKQAQLPQIDFISWDVIETFAEYKEKIEALQRQADGVALIGIFGFKDQAGNNVSYSEVLKWTAEHSKLPDFSFWADRVSYGTLCAVTVSGYEQGLAAGRIAREILKEGRSPDSFLIEPSVKGEPMISLARADRLGIKIRTTTLLSTQVIEKFEWEQQ